MVDLILFGRSHAVLVSALCYLGAVPSSAGRAEEKREQEFFKLHLY
jgi:hypothetical protein